MWRAKNEAFLSDVKWLDDLSVKASVGTSGNAEIGNYIAKAKVGGRGAYNGIKGQTLTNPGLPNLTWEKQLKFSAGFIASFLNIVRVDFNFYRRVTTDLIMDVPRSALAGFSALPTNVGKLSNTGVDIRLDVDVWKDKLGNHVTPYVTFNYNRQIVEELFGGRKVWTVPGGYHITYAVGKPVQLSAPRFYRVNPETGKNEWYLATPNDPSVPRTDPKATTDDPTLFQNEEQMLGSWMAPVQGGFGLNADLWGAYVQADFIYQLGKYLINNDRYFNENPIRFTGQNQSKNITKDSFWQKPGDTGKKYPSKANDSWMEFDDRLLENASFMRLKNLTIGYNFPKKWMEKTRFFNSAKVYTSMRNILTVTNFTGVDPEIDTNVTRAMNPNTKQFLFGVEFTF